MTFQLWDSVKAMFRGNFIAINSYTIKEENLKLII